MNGARGAWAAVGARGGSPNLGREWVGGSGGVGEGKERGGRGGAALEPRAESCEAAVVCESLGRRAGHSGTAVRRAFSVLAARCRLRDPEELPAPLTGGRGVRTGAASSDGGVVSKRPSPGPRVWRWGAEAPKGAPPRWATWRAPRGARASHPLSRCCRRPARCRCLSPVNWKSGSPWCW